MSYLEDSEEIQKVSGSTPNFKTELAEKLQSIVPEVISDGKVDVLKLQELLGDDSADESERYGLFWPGKKRATRAAQEPTTATLKPVPEESKDWDTTENIFIEGDNLEVLKILQKHYHNKIKMIYIDPPYNTGKDFVYPDNYKEGLQSYLEFTNQVDGEGRRVSTNSDTDGRYHSNWLNMMYPRLKLARNLLTDDGVIFISIDEHELDNLLKICNEIYGEINKSFILIRKSKTANNKSIDGTNVQHEYIVCYARDHSKLSFKGEEKTFEKYTNPDNDPNGDWITDNPTANLDGREKKNDFPIINPFTNREDIPPRGRHWVFNITDLAKFIESGKLVFKEKYSDSERGFILKRYKKDILSSFHTFNSLVFANNEYINEIATKDIYDLFEIKAFDYTKPVSLISKLVQYSTNKEDIVLDFFSGSATTAHAVMLLNAIDCGRRKNIQVQLPEPVAENLDVFKLGFMTIADVGKERIRRAGEKIKEEYCKTLELRGLPLDVGFRVYKLSDSNFTKWNTDSSVDLDKLQNRLFDMRESSNDNATQEALLTEILLKLGISLTAKVVRREIDGLTLWNVNQGVIYACLDETNKPTIEQLRNILSDTEIAKFVMLEDAFHGDDELKTNLTQICRTNKIELWTV